MKDEKETYLLSQLEMAVRQSNVMIMGDINYLDIDCADRTTHSFKAPDFLNVLQDNFTH